MKITIDGPCFKDEHGRTLILRGVNLGGSSKVPTRPDGATWKRESFFGHRDVSFIGRPFPLEDANRHFARLRRWGFTFLRFLVTWEAIEHAGPGIYDQDYLDYLHAVIKAAAEHDIQLFIDPHQDVWSRFSGGDGAPGWIFEAVGMDITRFAATGAALTHQEHGDPFPRMIWPTNYGKLANLTMWTLFFAGNDLAPATRVDGIPVQEYLQSHYINAIKQVTLRLKELPNVVGYDTLNEPSAGLIEVADLNAPAGMLQVGDSPTPLQAMALGAGYPQQVQRFEMGPFGPRKTGTRLLNPDGERVWLDGCRPVWQENGVWGLGDDNVPVILRPNHFTQVCGRPVDFHRDYYRPFANRFAREIRSVQPAALIFLEGVPTEGHLTWTSGDADRVVHAAHWYDSITLYLKRYLSWVTADFSTRRLVIGPGRVRRSRAAQIARIVEASRREMNGAPTLIGEVGIPFDLDRKAYRSGNFARQITALDATMQALEANLASFTLWNYTADNDNRRGDQWNDEDLSIYSADQMTGSGDLDDGGRALQAAVRPYPRAVAGEPLHLSFDIRRRRFEFTFRHDDAISAPTLIYLPRTHYPGECAVHAPDGSCEIDWEKQTLTYRPAAGSGVHTLVITPAD